MPEPQRFEYFVVQCRGCARKVYRSVDSVPIASHARWKCSKCGHRGADLTRTWSWKKPDLIQ